MPPAPGLSHEGNALKRISAAANTQTRHRQIMTLELKHTFLLIERACSCTQNLHRTVVNTSLTRQMHMRLKVAKGSNRSTHFQLLRLGPCRAV